jgi:hypothetical protein
MNDADQTIDVSLETDRLEQLLEVPAPAQPVVMIEYRNRGVPWWLVVGLIVLVPLVAVVCYQQLVVQGYQARAADVAYQLAKKAANDNAALPPRSEASPAEPVGSIAAPGPAPIVMTAESAPPASAKSPSTPPAVSEGSAGPPHPDGSSNPTVAGLGQTPEPRVRTIFPSPLELAGNSADPKGSSTDHPIGPPSATPGRTMPSDDSVNTQLAKLAAQPPAGPNSGPRQAGPAAKAATGASPPAAAANGNGPGDRGQPVPAIAPLPSKDRVPLPSADEFNRGIEEESAKKAAEKIEEQAAQLDRMRTRRYEDRVRFHEELSQILASVSDRSGAEIDAIAKRYRGDIDPKAFGKARKIWRTIQLPLATRVSRMRELDVTEPVILDFMSDNFVARMHTRGGPRDSNEVRVWAAQLLVKCTLSDEAAARTPASGPGSPPRQPRVGDSPPQ